MTRRLHVIALATPLFASACIEFQQIEARREFLGTHIGERQVEARSERGASSDVFSAQVQGDNLLIALAHCGLCSYQRVEDMRVTLRVEPSATQWRVGGRAFGMTTALGTISLASGAGLIAGGFFADSHASALALWSSGGTLLGGGLAALAGVLSIVARSKTRLEVRNIPSSPGELYDRPCAATPFGHQPFLLRRGNITVPLATDKGGQLRLPLHQLEWLRLQPGDWEIERWRSHRMLGRLTIPEHPESARLPNPFNRRLTIQLQAPRELTALAERVAAEAGRRLRASDAAEPASSASPPLLVLGMLEPQTKDDVVGVDIKLTDATAYTVLANGAHHGVSTPDEEGIVQTVVRLVDELLSHE